MWNTKMFFGGDPVKGQWDQEYHETKKRVGKGPLSSLHSGKRGKWWEKSGDLECGGIIEKSSLSVA